MLTLFVGAGVCLSLSGAYLVRRRGNDNHTEREHWVEITDSSTFCSECDFCQNMLLPCRHVFAANLVRWETAELFRISQCHHKWHLSMPAAAHGVAAQDLVGTPVTVRAEQSSNPATSGFWTELSNNQLHINLMAAAARLSGFMKPHGEQAYEQVQQRLASLVEYYSKTAPPGRSTPVPVRHCADISMTLL